MKNIKFNNGITLIALVITIVVLLILAGVGIRTLEEHGIIEKARNAKEMSDTTQDREIADAHEMLDLKNNHRTDEDVSNDDITQTPTVNHNGEIIPDGATYQVATVVGEDDFENPTYTYTTLNAGEYFPENSNSGDIYTYGDYEYRYNQYLGHFDMWHTVESQNGWHVLVLDDTKTTYGFVLDSINNKPINNMWQTFSGCKKMTSLPEGFTIPDTVTQMNSAFNGCHSMTSLPDSFRLPNNLKDMIYLFENCISLKSLPEEFTVPNSVTDMSYAFSYCTALETLPENFVIPSSVTDISYAFQNCTALEILPENFTIPDNVINMSRLFKECTSLKELPEAFSVPNAVTSTRATFQNCTSLSSLPNGFTMGNSVTDMGWMFYGCTLLKELPKSFTIPNSVENMEYAFSYCEALETLSDVFTIGDKVTNMKYMFRNCISLTDTITINATPTTYDLCFYGCDMSNIVLTGSSEVLDKLRSTAGSN